MKDLKYAVESDTINKLLQSCYEHDIEVEEFQGVLNDSYIIHNDGLFSVKNKNSRSPKGRKFILVIPEYRNEWSNALFILCTDNEELVNNYRTTWELSAN